MGKMGMWWSYPLSNQRIGYSNLYQISIVDFFITLAFYYDFLFDIYLFLPMYMFFLICQKVWTFYTLSPNMVTQADHFTRLHFHYKMLDCNQYFHFFGACYVPDSHAEGEYSIFFPLGSMASHKVQGLCTVSDFFSLMQME
ncbi:hypothetical protein ACJX0J_024150, partial [Zea mays]